MSEVNADRARSNLQKLTGKQLERACEVFDIERVVEGRRLTAKHIRCALMGVDAAVKFFGREDFHPKDLKRAAQVEIVEIEGDLLYA